MALTSNSKWQCKYCASAIYGSGTDKELEEMVKEHFQKHESATSPVEGKGNDKPKLGS